MKQIPLNIIDYYNTENLLFTYHNSLTIKSSL